MENIHEKRKQGKETTFITPKDVGKSFAKDLLGTSVGHYRTHIHKQQYTYTYVRRNVSMLVYPITRNAYICSAFQCLLVCITYNGREPLLYIPRREIIEKNQGSPQRVLEIAFTKNDECCGRGREGPLSKALGEKERRGEFAGAEPASFYPFVSFSTFP